MVILETHRVNNNDDDSLNADIQCNSFTIEEECFISFVPSQPDNLFAFPNSKDVLDDLLFYNNNNNSINNEAYVGNDGVLDDNYNYGVIYDKTDDANPSSLPPETSMPCIYSIIREVNKEFQFWSKILNEEPYGDNDDTYNYIVPNQADNNRPNNGESKIILLRSWEDLVCSRSEFSIGEINTNATILENVTQYQRLNTLIYINCYYIILAVVKRSKSVKVILKVAEIRPASLTLMSD